MSEMIFGAIDIFVSVKCVAETLMMRANLGVVQHGKAAEDLAARCVSRASRTKITNQKINTTHRGHAAPRAKGPLLLELGFHGKRADAVRVVPHCLVRAALLAVCIDLDF